MSEYKIMIVDDEPDILDLLEKALTIEGFHNILKVDNGNNAVSTCKEVNPDAIILDVMLPDIDGYEVCKRIRQFSHCPILFLSSKNDEVDKILGLAVGGDDYVTKPFSPKEVAFRVKAQLRRAEYRQSAEQPHAITIGELTIDPDGCRAFKNGKDLELTAKEFEILHDLAQNRGRVISRERLYERIWGEDSFGCDNTMMVHIRHLREKIEDELACREIRIKAKILGHIAQMRVILLAQSLNCFPVQTDTTGSRLQDTADHPHQSRCFAIARPSPLPSGFSFVFVPR